MEVHAHTHTARKKFTHYLWEFLMLFLAVFCGFLAENLREHKIESDREKQFIRSLLEDLREDTLILTANINDCAAHLERNDSLIRLLNSNDIKEHGSDLYYLGRWASRGIRLAVHDLTIQQMKNSGGFRLIRKEKVSKAIIEYYNLLVFITYLQNVGMDEQQEYRKMAIDVFHPILFGDVVKPDNTITRPQGNPSLLTYESKVLLRLAGMLSYIKNTKLGLIGAETNMKVVAIELIQLIKKEYHLSEGTPLEK